MHSVSVVVPCYNSESIIERCLRSCLYQEYKIDKIIVVDDGSRDNTLSIVKKEFGHIDNVLIVEKENGGIASARNEGLNLVDSKLVAFLDHDDVMLPGKIRHQVRLLSSDEEFSFVASAYNNLLISNGKEVIKKNKVYCKDIWIALIHGRLGRTSSNLWRTADINSVGGWMASDGLSLDTGLMFRLLKQGFWPLLDNEVHTTRFVTPESASNANRMKQWATFIDMRMNIFHYLKQENLLTREREEALFIDLINAFRGLFRVSPEIAVSKHSELPMKRSSISQYPIGPGRLYRQLYRLLGFKAAEEVYKVWTMVRRA
jgi:glycosyltransferase involved in cell wall biosynthesis